MEQTILKELSITEYEIIGSYNDPNINNDVISDIDAQNKEIYNNNELETYNKILDHFKYLFKLFKNNKRIVITDFKCGVGKANIPYRWNYKSIMKGFQYEDNNNKVYFIDQLQKHSVIKIDILAYIPKYNEYMEITMNYYFNFGNIDKSYHAYTFDDILTAIKKDVYELREEGNYYKSLKRLNSYNRLLKKNNKNLIKIINSEYGIKSREKSKLSNLLYAMENKSKFNKNDIKNVNNKNLTIPDIKNKIDELDKEINSNSLLELIKKYKLY
jgi:hypothetical protein